MSQATIEQALQSAVQHGQAGRNGDAEAICRQILAAHPDHAEAWCLLSLLAAKAGHYPSAMEHISNATASLPNHPKYHYIQAGLLRDQKHFVAAIDSYRRAIALHEGFVQAYFQMANLFNRMQNFDEAIASYRRVLELQPDHANARANLGSALKSIGRVEEAIACYRQALALQPGSIITHDNLLLAMQYDPASDRESQFVEYQKWNQQHAKPLAKFIQPHVNDSSPDRRLRIGYVSPDFGDHPVGWFMLPLLNSHDESQVELFCYSQLAESDEMTTKLKAASDHWRDIAAFSDEQVTEMIRADQIDILVNLALHTAKNRLLVFARKPAPVQVAYLGYAAGTAVQTIDYRLTDQYLDPDQTQDQFYLEKSQRLAGTYWCYSPNPNATPVTDLPAESSGRVTFCCLNNLTKVSQDVLALWARLLGELSDARLILHCPAGDHRQSILELFQRYSVSPDRLEIISRVSAADYFGLYNKSDIALDPFPFCGGTTTCDALWMGVPVISLAGRTTVGRAGVSILSNAGLPELIAQTPDEYVRLTVELANDLPLLAKYRKTIRQRMRNSPLMDTTRFARNIESAYRSMWKTWCQT